MILVHLLLLKIQRAKLNVTPDNNQKKKAKRKLEIIFLKLSLFWAYQRTIFAKQSGEMTPRITYLGRRMRLTNCFTFVRVWEPLMRECGHLYRPLWNVVSVQCSRSVLSDSLRPHGLQHTRPPCLSPTPGVYSNSCLLSPWCHPTISPSVC